MTEMGLIVAMLRDGEGGEVGTVVFLAPGPRLVTVSLPAKRRRPSRP